MTTEITHLAANAALASSARSAVSAGELLKVLQPMEGVMALGQSAQAEVLDLKQTAQNFQLLLRLTLAGGLQSTVQVASNQPLAQGTQLLVSLLAGQQLAVTSTTSPQARLTQIDLQKVPVGTLVQAKVVTSLAMEQPNGTTQYRSMVSVLNTALAGQTLIIDSPQPLRVNSLLSAQVQGNQQLSFVPSTGNLDSLVLSQQLTTQQGRQISLSALMNAVQTLRQGDSLPPQVKAAAEALMAQLPSSQQMSDPKGVAQAIQHSGIFLEPALLASPAAPPPPDLKGALLRLVAQLAPQAPTSPMLNPTFNPTAAAMVPQALPGFVRTALSMLGQVGAKPQLGGFPLPDKTLPRSDAEADGDLEHLLRLAAGAVSRLQSHQLGGLEQSRTLDDGRVQTTWQLEIPMRHAQDIVPLQVRLQSHDPAPDPEGSSESMPNTRQKVWRLELAFDLAPLGPLQVQAQLIQGNLSSELWAEQPYTAQLIESQLGYLRERLSASGLNVGDLNCHLGAPPQGPRNGVERRWVDDTA